MWLYLHRHDYQDGSRDGRPKLPMLLDTKSGITIQMHAQNGKADGCWLRRPGDDGKGGLWLAESFAEICDRIDEAITLTAADRAEIAQWVR